MENKTILKKYQLKKEFTESLKLFFIIVRPVIIPDIPDERAIGIIAYRSMDAIQKAQKDIGESMRVIFHQNDYVEVEQLLKRTNLEGVILDKNTEQLKQVLRPARKEKYSVEEKTMITHDIGFDGFKAGLLFATDKYLKNKEDKQAMKKLIKRCREK